MASVFLSREEEIQAWNRGDFDAVVRGVLPCAYRIAKKISKGDRYLEDEFESFIGEQIAKALKTFKPGQYRFSTYALSHLAVNLYRVRNQVYRARNLSLTGEVAEKLPARHSQTNAVDNVEMMNHVFEAVANQRTAEILLARYSGYTLAECGQMFGVSKERIRQIENYFLDRARSYLLAKFKSGHKKSA